MKCKKCGNVNLNIMEFCAVCGSKLPETAKTRRAAKTARPRPETPETTPGPSARTHTYSCSVCGIIYGDENRFCPSCGTPRSDEVAGICDTALPELDSVAETAWREAGDIVCTQCGRICDESESFCRNCGAAVGQGAKTGKPSIGGRRITASVVGLAFLIVLIVGGFILFKNARYSAAVNQMNAGRYIEAYDTFSKLGDYEDSEKNAAECYPYVRYAEAVELMDEGKYIQARGIFDELSGFIDVKDKVKECENYIDYEEAEALCDEGNYGQAYEIFDKLGDFENSEERKKACIQPPPQSGLADKGGSYITGEAQFTVYNPLDNDVYILLYGADHSRFWGMIYVRAHESATVMMSPGEYAMSAGTGEEWFGPVDRFKKGEFVKEVIVNGQKTFTVPPGGYDYYIGD